MFCLHTETISDSTHEPTSGKKNTAASASSSLRWIVTEYHMSAVKTHHTTDARSAAQERSDPCSAAV